MAPAIFVFAERGLVCAPHSDVINEIIQDQGVIIVVSVHVPGQLQLAEVVDAIDGLRAGFAPAQYRQQQAGENGDDGNDDEQFNEGESTRLRFHKFSRAVSLFYRLD